MARPKEWEKFARDLRIDLSHVISRIKREEAEIVKSIELGRYDNEDHSLLEDLIYVIHLTGKADGLQSQIGRLIEDNMGRSQKTFAENEERILNEHRKGKGAA